MEFPFKETKSLPSTHKASCQLLNTKKDP